MSPHRSRRHDRRMDDPDAGPWPPPPPTTTTRATTPPRHAPVRPTLDRPRLSAAGWLAAAGASLLLVAAIVVVAGSWRSIPVEVRFAGLVAALVAVYFAAEAIRRSAPLTAAALAALAATLTAPVGVAAAATASQPWPVCIVVGGSAALIACELQARRWKLRALHAATVVAFGLVAVGAAALTSVPVPLIGAGGAVVAILIGWPRRAVVLGLAVGCTPIVTALSDAGVGPGTLERLGLDPSAPTWPVTLACSIASVVVGVVAHRRRNAPLAIAALAVFASGAIAGAIHGDLDPVVVWCIPAVLLLTAEIVGAMGGESIWRDLGRRVTGPLSAAIAFVGLTLPYRVVAQRPLPASPAGDPWWIPIGLCGLALLASACGSRRRSNRDDLDGIVIVAASACAVAALAATGWPLWASAVAALVLWAVSSRVLPWTNWDVNTAVFVSWVLVAEVVAGGPVVVRLALVIAAGLALTISVSGTPRGDEGLRLVASALVVGAAAAIVSGGAPAAAGVTVCLGLIAVGVALRPDALVVPLVVASLVVARVLVPPGQDSAVPSAVDWLDVTSTGLLALAFGASTRSVGSVRAHTSAGLVVIAAALAVARADLEPGTATLVAAVTAVALSGLSFVDRRFAPAQTAGLVAAVLSVLVSRHADPAFTSLTVSLLGGHIAVDAASSRQPLLAGLGAGVSAVGAGSLWWTTGTNAWAIESIAPYGASGTDLVVAASVGILLGAGSAVRRRIAVSSWLAYGPGLAMAGAWLLSSQLEPGTTWATVAALAIGTMSVGVGGVRRLAAPLVSGTVTLVGTLVLSAGPRLAAAPTWAWMVAGGVALLAVAALVERSDRPLVTLGRRHADVRSLLDEFCDEFG